MLVSTEAGRVCGEKWHESSARYDPHGSSWKTHRCLWEEDLPWSSVTLPNWGMTHGGVVFQRQSAARLTNATDSGLLHTPPMQVNHTKPCGGGKRTELGLNSATKEKVSAEHRPRTRRRRSSSITHTWPTPVASMAKGSSPRSLTRRSGASRARDRLDHAVMASDHGHLNPAWVEWLMGWPIGWTDLKPLEMDKFHEWQLQHSNCCVLKNDKEAA